MEMKRRRLARGIVQHLGQFVGRVFDDRANSALIWARTRLYEHQGNLFSARKQLLSFATSVDDLLETHWPEVIPNAASR